VFDVAYALEYVAPFRDDDTCRRWLAYPRPPDRRGRLELFARAYGLVSTDDKRPVRGRHARRFALSAIPGS
jgi:hypothetical protein